MTAELRRRIDRLVCEQSTVIERIGTSPKNKESPMNDSRLDSNPQFVGGVRELVRGSEQEILDALQPLVRSRSVHLDLSSIERIDAAGLAALVSLFCDARKAGHDFAVVNPPRHVARILAIVGLDRILMARGSREALPSGSRKNEIAA
jgi:anti-anti-sigma factor